MKKLFFLLSCSILSLYTSYAHAEVEKIILKWNSAVCQRSCVEGLLSQLNRIPGVAEAKMSGGAGVLEIRWKPDHPFSYYPIKTAMQMIGLHIDDLRLTVRGTLSHSANQVFLNSLGDSSRFVLMSPTRPGTNRYVESKSLYTHELSPDLRAQLMEKENTNTVVTVEGPLFEPEQRSPPYFLIVESLRFPPPLSKQPIVPPTNRPGYAELPRG